MFAHGRDSVKGCKRTGFDYDTKVWIIYYSADCALQAEYI